MITHKNQPGSYLSLRDSNIPIPTGSFLQAKELPKKGTLRHTESIKGSGICSKIESPKGSAIKHTESPGGSTIKKAHIFFQQEQERAASPLYSSLKAPVILTKKDGVFEKIGELEKNAPRRSSSMSNLKNLNLHKRLSGYIPPIDPKIDEIKKSNSSNIQTEINLLTEATPLLTLKVESIPKLKLKSHKKRSKRKSLPHKLNQELEKITKPKENVLSANPPPTEILELETSSKLEEKNIFIADNQLKEKLQSKSETQISSILPPAPPLKKSETSVRSFKGLLRECSSVFKKRHETDPHNIFLSEVELVLQEKTDQGLCRKGNYQLVTMQKGSLSWASIEDNNFLKDAAQTLSSLIKKLNALSKSEDKNLPSRIRFVTEYLLHNQIIRSKINSDIKIRKNFIKLNRNLLYYHLYKDVKLMKKMLKNSASTLNTMQEYFVKESETHVKEILKPFHSKSELEALDSLAVTSLVSNLNHSDLIGMATLREQKKHLEIMFDDPSLIPMRTKSLPGYSLGNFLDKSLACCRKFLIKYVEILDLESCLLKMPELNSHSGSTIPVKARKEMALNSYKNYDYAASMGEVFRADTVAINSCMDILPVALRDFCQRIVQVLLNKKLITKEEAAMLNNEIDSNTNNKKENLIVQWAAIPETLLRITKFFPDQKKI